MRLSSLIKTNPFQYKRKKNQIFFEKNCAVSVSDSRLIDQSIIFIIPPLSLHYYVYYMQIRKINVVCVSLFENHFLIIIMFFAQRVLNTDRIDTLKVMMLVSNNRLNEVVVLAQ